MAEGWIPVCSAKEIDWGVPGSALINLSALTGTAASALETAKNETTRTSSPQPGAKKLSTRSPCSCGTSSGAISSPRLPRTRTTSLWVSNPTTLVGRHELGLKILYVTGSPDDPANKGYRIWYAVVGAGETPPTNSGGLRMSFFTKRKKDIIEFAFGDSGKRAYFAIQIENDGKKGLWGR
jgi:hypothetical protein